ncbi:TPA: hypothetical protein N0F65_011325 [Lagenidium giganteum]|uniref:RNA-binding protein 48 n=1 Tax=Lagenidium giganteum TaxID=4803 RepID=A0AAV2YFQ3_9STRA|nr:TPA: hypothetical protein N0F65_011325 [Lagenidium giganteum]
MAPRDRERNVRVFTVAHESRYVVVRNVPSLGVIEDLLKRLSLYGRICEYRVLDHLDDRHRALVNEDDADEDNATQQFTDVVWVQYEDVINARHAKIRAVQKPFFGSMLRICYAPQYETIEDTALKLKARRELLERRAQPPQRQRREPVAAVDGPAVDAEFIGPRLPSQAPAQWQLKSQPPPPPRSDPPMDNPKPKRRRI